MSLASDVLSLLSLAKGSSSLDKAINSAAASPTQPITNKPTSLEYPETYEDRQQARANSGIIWLMVIALIILIVVAIIGFFGFRSVSSAVTDAVVVATDVATALVDTANKALAKIAEVVEAAIDLVADLVRYLREAVEAILVPAYQTIKDFFAALYGFFAPIASQLYNWFNDAISAVLGIWDNYITPFFGQITAYANDLLSALGL